MESDGYTLSPDVVKIPQIAKHYQTIWIFLLYGDSLCNIGSDTKTLNIHAFIRQKSCVSIRKDPLYGRSRVYYSKSQPTKLVSISVICLNDCHRKKVYLIQLLRKVEMLCGNCSQKFTVRR